MELDDFQRDNQANWDDRAVVHAGSDMYSLDWYMSDQDAVSPTIRFDAELFGDITGMTVAHLQCHIGTDTISLARLGADVVGVDFSEQAIDVATRLAADANTPTEFVLANVYDAAEAVGRTVDFVYTSVGTVNWLADLDRWANAVSGLLEPGGRFYFRDGHPFMWIWEDVDGATVPTYDYFTTSENPLSWDENETYTDGDHTKITHTRHHEWNHSIPEMVNALVGAGMTIDRMEEHRGLEWPLTPSFVKEGDQWFFPPELRSKVPAMYSLWATKR